MLASLERLGVFSRVSLDLPADTSYDRYEALGIFLATHHRQVSWLIGDWINFGRSVFGMTSAQAEHMTQLSSGTLDNYSYTARRFPPERRRLELPFSVHTTVAPLPPQQQDEMLERTFVNRWTREELRAQIHPVADDILTPALDPVVDLEQAARELVRSAKSYGSDYLVLRPFFVALCAALGEPDVE